MWLTLVSLEAQELEDDDLSLEIERLKKNAWILEVWRLCHRRANEEDEVGCVRVNGRRGRRRKEKRGFFSKFSNS
jgi:hypothetical protein